MCERSPKHVSRELKTDWGKRRQAGRKGGACAVRAWMGEYWPLVGERGRGIA